MGTSVTSIRNFTRMNPAKFHGSKVEEDPQEFIDEIYKILGIMGFFMVEKVELATYQLKCCSTIGMKRVRFSEHGRPQFRKKFFGQGSSNAATPKLKKYRMPNPKPQGSGDNESSIPMCSRCGTKRDDKCLAGTDCCFGGGKSGLKVKDCQLQASKGKDGRKVQPSDSSLDDPRQDKFYVFQTRQNHEGSPDVVTAMLKIFI
ncbi:hypothetical protein MTR67_052387 [Solanum verrucosum]|uniref:Gag-pol polyprotein n=1 Tax=Solanum verrucosum TaxID=315347 RepID=A0AAF0V636_SOLVR|nr:hypothetical protein MTR67_052387 [Solanum verrucosum]